MSENENDTQPRKNDVFGHKQPQAALPAQQRAPVMPEVPREIVPLPSNGRVYPALSSLHGATSVEIRTMVAKDEDILTSPALAKSGKMLSYLIRACLIDKSVDANSLLSGDRYAIMTAIRITGYGRSYAVEVECPDCEEKSEYEFDLAQLPIQRLELEPVTLGENMFEFLAPSGRKIMWRFLTGHDEEAMAAEQRAKKKHNLQQDHAVTSRLLRMIVSIDGLTDRQQLSTLVQNMPVSDSQAFRDFVNAHEPGIEMKGTFTCNSCGESSEVDVPFGSNFFWPKSKR